MSCGRSPHKFLVDGAKNPYCSGTAVEDLGMMPNVTGMFHNLENDLAEKLKRCESYTDGDSSEESGDCQRQAGTLHHSHQYESWTRTPSNRLSIPNQGGGGSCSPRRCSLPANFEINEIEENEEFPEPTASSTCTFPDVPMDKNGISLSKMMLTNSVNVRDSTLNEAAARLGLSPRETSSLSLHCGKSTNDAVEGELTKQLTGVSMDKRSIPTDLPTAFPRDRVTPKLSSSWTSPTRKNKVTHGTSSTFLPSSARYLSPSPPPSGTVSPCWSPRSLSPEPMRRRANTFSGNVRNIGADSPMRMPRDRLQPTRGSLSDRGNKDDQDDEELDSFQTDVLPAPRPRSNTCPEHRAWKRRVKVQRERTRSRPGTPPPGDIDSSQTKCLISVAKQRLDRLEAHSPKINDDEVCGVMTSAPVVKATTLPHIIKSDSVPLRGFTSNCDNAVDDRTQGHGNA